VELLAHPNGWQRETAQRLLFERQDLSIAGQLKLLANTSDRPPARAHALWLLDALDRLEDSTIVAGLNDAHPGVAEQAARLAEERAEQSPQLADAIERTAAGTGNGRLRFQCVLSLSAFPWTRERGSLFALLAVQQSSDEWLQTALTLTGHDPATIARAVLFHLVEAETRGELAQHREQIALLRRFTELAAMQQDGESVREVLDRLSPFSKDLRFIRVAAFCSGLRIRGTTWEQVATDLGKQVSSDVEATFAAAGYYADEPVKGQASEAVRVLEFAPWANANVLLKIAKSHPQQSVRAQAIAILARRSEAEIGPALMEGFSSETPANRAAILSTMYNSADRLRLLLGEIAAGHVSPREIDPTRANQLRNHRDAGIRERAQALLKDDTDADRAKVLADYHGVLSARSDPKRGREVFAKNCVQCHKVGDLGVNVAPDISDSRVKTAEQLLVSILDPNRAIDNNYFSYTVVDRDGLVQTGVIASETATSVTLRQPEGKEVTLLRSDIDELKSNGVSLMPVGLEKNISVEQMADLISFIKNWRYLDGSVPPEVIR
jgi:putative heme-binding domain-containing protein